MNNVIASIGLVADMIGAWLIAWEVINQYKGAKHDPTPTCYNQSPPPSETEKYVRWQQKKHRIMVLGLLFLTVGFALQIVANWI